MIMEKCLISLSSYAYGLLMLMVTKCLPTEDQSDILIYCSEVIRRALLTQICAQLEALLFHSSW